MADRGIIMTSESVRAIRAGTKTQTRRVIDRVDPTAHGDPHQFMGPHEVVWTSSDPERTPHVMVGVPYHVGDTLWVREAFAVRKLIQPAGDGPWLLGPLKGRVQKYGGGAPVRRGDLRCDGDSVSIAYAANPNREEFAAAPGRFDVYRSEDPPRWRSPRFMPRWASRLTMRVTEVRCERVQAISDADAFAEGMRPGDGLWHHSRDGGYRADEFGWYVNDVRHNAPSWAFAAAWEIINGKRAPWDANPWVWVVSFALVERNRW